MLSEPFSPSRAHTLRFRLMAWNAAVVVITALITLLGLREGVRFTLIKELDQLLAEDVREIELALANVDGARSPQLHQQLDRKDTGHAQHKWFVQLIGAHNDVLYQSQHVPIELKKLPAEDKYVQTVKGWRIYNRRVEDLTIRVGSSLELIYSDVRRIDRLVAMAAGLVLLVAPLCGYWLAGRATRPLNKMIDTLAELRPSRLDERLQIRGTGDELDRLSNDFNSLLDRIGTHLQERRDFLANAAHELRTPLAAIRSSIEVALGKKRSSEDYESLLSDIIEESSLLESLVNQLLLLSETEVESLCVHSENVRLDELIEKAMDMFGGVAEYRDIHLLCPALPTAEVKGNPQHLRHVIYNLLDNALKFTSAGGMVQVQLLVRKNQIVFSVHDTGIGIKPDDLPYVFDRFFRGDHNPLENPEVRGTGLGLSICRSIIRAYGGQIEVASQAGQGTVFTVKFPAAIDGLHSNKVEKQCNMSLS